MRHYSDAHYLSDRREQMPGAMGGTGVGLRGNLVCPHAILRPILAEKALVRSENSEKAWIGGSEGIEWLL